MDDVLSWERRVWDDKGFTAGTQELDIEKVKKPGMSK